MKRGRVGEWWTLQIHSDGRYRRTSHWGSVHRRSVHRRSVHGTSTHRRTAYRSCAHRLNGHLRRIHRRRIHSDTAAYLVTRSRSGGNWIKNPAGSLLPSPWPDSQFIFNWVRDISYFCVDPCDWTYVFSQTISFYLEGPEEQGSLDQAVVWDRRFPVPEGAS